MLKCRSAVVDWQQTCSDFDVTSTMLKYIAKRNVYLLKLCIRTLTSNCE
ncbi:hypothetical protein NP493_119g01021 [Ridgeia piscesae]|uniref:Uncharacterized protein n=1 Tax=Ridgeia piscesae TaxID=27915 RepID=A0AAD9P678_RIDPI|nr:hypothetical protein NP493_119g01021 [Ridgeia piscesae]